MRRPWCTQVDSPIHFSAQACSLECNDKGFLLKID